ncbi:MAG TPA: TMEM175 family protein [Marinobacter sp.]|nr:TMEM175 family protein [Marinobacter sp.]
MGKNRLEAFSDGVLAIVITIMVLGLKVPEGAGMDVLAPILPSFLSYILSFIYVGIYWNNHHHLIHAAEHVSGRILWSNLNLLFWLSLFGGNRVIFRVLLGSPGNLCGCGTSLACARQKNRAGDRRKLTTIRA